MIDVYFNGKKLTDLIFANVKYGVMPEVDITSKQVANSNGIRFIKKRYKEYYVEVEFALKGEIEEGKRKLAQALDVNEPSILTTTKEPNLYWNAIVDGKIDWETIEKTGLGKINFLVPDGIAHSLITKSKNAVLGVIEIENDGTYPSNPVIKATMNSDNGFLALVNQEGALLQFGKPDEVDGENYTKSETLINDRMNGNQTGWTQNVANLTAWDSPLTQAGTTGHFNFEGTEVTNPTSYGTGTGWHGPSLTKLIPADSNEHAGAKNFELEVWHMFESGTLSDIGMCQFSISDATGRVITDLSFYKKSQGNNNGALQWHVNGVVVKEDPFTPNYNNAYTSRGTGRTIIKKFGDMITIVTGGRTYTYRESSLENVEAAKISWYAAKWGTFAPVAANYLMQMTFKKHNVDKWRDIPNQFTNGDVITINTKENKVYKNNILTYEVETRGNQWDKFKIKNGMNQITCMWSSWATEPEIILEYEEAYL